MQPTLRPALVRLTRLFAGFRSRRRNAAAPQPRRLAPQLVPLEDRTLQAFALTSITAVPSTLWPPNGQYDPVEVSGTFKEFTVVNNKQIFKTLPGPKKSSFNVVDEYHRDEPKAPIQLVAEGGGVFTFSFTIHLQAERSTEYPAGRRYYINVAAMDSDGWSGWTIPVQVPVSLNDRGPGPVVGKPSKTFTLNQEHKAALAQNHAPSHATTPTPTKTGLGSIFSGL